MVFAPQLQSVRKKNGMEIFRGNVETSFQNGQLLVDIQNFSAEIHKSMILYNLENKKGDFSWTLLVTSHGHFLMVIINSANTIVQLTKPLLFSARLG